MTQAEYLETHEFTKIIFWWFEGGNEVEIPLRMITYNKGVEIAQGYGFKPPTWYKPWTWRNGIITVG